MDEDHPLNPMSPYASAKCGADRLVYSYWRTYDLPAVIVRPFNNYGPCQHLEKVVPRFVTSVLLGEPLTIHGDGTAARDFVYVEDVCHAIDLVMHAPREKVLGEAFNVASGRHRSINEIAEDIVRVMDAPDSNLQTVGNRPGQVFRHTGNSAKIRERLGWKPQMTWEDGLQATIDWFSANRDWWGDQIWMRHIEIRTASGNIELH
jgi:dTDP-glucose 4,6-dehydratase